MGEGSRVAIRYKKETVYGVPPTGEYRELGFEEESFILDRQKEKSKRVLQTREYSHYTAKTQMTTGGFKNPLQAYNTDELFEGVLMSSWIDITGGSGGGFITAGASGSNLEISFTAEAGAGVGGLITFGSGVSITLLKDQVIFVNGTTDAENDGSYIIKEIAGNQITVNSPLTTAIYEAGCEVHSDMLRNGATISSYTFERAHLDIDSFFQYVGEVCSTLEIGFESETEVSLSFDFLGKDELDSTESISSPLPTASPVNPDFVCGDNVDGVFIDYVLQPECLIQSLSFKVDNQTESKKSIAVFGPCKQRIKPIDVTGSITMSMDDMTNYIKYKNDITLQLCLIIGDSLGNKFSFTSADTEFTSASANVSDAEDEVPEEHDFGCTTNGAFTFQICKYTI